MSATTTALGRVAVLNRDLMFGVKIANTLRGIGYAVDLVPTTPAFAALLRAEPSPVLGILDMGARPDWEEIGALTANPALAPILAFGPHVDVAARRAAKAAGVARLLSNGDFHRDMVALVARYARSVERQPITDPAGDPAAQ